MPPDRMIGGMYCVCLSVVNFNLRYNFWTIRDRDFICDVHTPQMTPFQMTSRSMTLWPWSKNSFWGFVATGGIHVVFLTPWFFFLSCTFLHHFCTLYTKYHSYIFVIVMSALILHKCVSFYILNMQWNVINEKKSS